jgi:acetoin utilization deacetylase AcuC-like enzyme
MVERATLAIVDDPRFDLHRAEGPHPERPARLDAARAGLRAALGDSAGISLEARTASPDELAVVHAAPYLRDLERTLDGHPRGRLDEDTYFGPETREAAWYAAGGAIQLAEALMAGTSRRALALLRPPGHHAEPDRAMGFCLLNNIALAARAAQRAGARRVAIIDWDVHHGNGTQHAFEQDPDVLFVSLHQWPLYPGTGGPHEIGRDAGLGRTANLALPAGSGDEVYGEAFRRVVLPLVRAHAPDLILVSAGFDAHARDPLAAMELSEAAYAGMTTALVDAADALGHGRVGFVLEGGYDLVALEVSVAATVRAAVGATRTELPTGRIPEAALEAIERTRSALHDMLDRSLDG